MAGEVQDYYLRTAMQPSQALSLAVGLMVPTVLVCGNVIGPSGPKGCALQQTVMGIAPTSGGKLWAIDFVKECVNKALGSRNHCIAPWCWLEPPLPGQQWWLA